MAELANIRQELADLQIKYAEARDDAREAREKLLDKVESTHTDVAEFEQLRKERDDLLQVVEGFHMERNLARLELIDAQQQIDLLEGKLRGEKDMKATAEAVTARLTVEVSQR